MSAASAKNLNFYPRPPCGGRPLTSLHSSQRTRRFLSTPSVWRATENRIGKSLTMMISIHALRVEGDNKVQIPLFKIMLFLSTPSVWRATNAPYGQGGPSFWISIHALRVEGDGRTDVCVPGARYFYPRPPCGGRPVVLVNGDEATVFLSTPSVWRATVVLCSI